MTLFSAGLIVIDGDSDERRHNVFIYLLMMHAGAAAVIVPVAFVDFAWWQMPVHAYDSKNRAAQARNRHHDESLEQTGRKNREEEESLRLTNRGFRPRFSGIANP
jgi:hypothetical protein